MLGVYAYDGTFLGYLIAQSLGATAAWGGLSVGELGLEDAVALARRTASALNFVGLTRGAHHCLCATSRGLDRNERARRESEFIDALQPLARRGLVRIMYRDAPTGLEASFAREAATAAAAASVIAVLERLQIDPSRATFAIYRPTPLARETSELLFEHGMRPVGNGEEALAADVDVLLVGAGPWAIGLAEATAVRARIILPLGTANTAPHAEQRMHQRGTTLLPDTLAIAGMMSALDYRARGVTGEEAVHRALATLRPRVEALIQESESLAATAQTAAT
jgi:hypothetical protein